MGVDVYIEMHVRDDGFWSSGWMVWVAVWVWEWVQEVTDLG